MKLGILLCALALGGCVRVHPWQREHLAQKAMVADESKGEARFQGHARGAREGAEGGSGEAGGGCGCN